MHMQCTRCAAETHTEHLCAPCAGTLRTILDRIPDALHTAEATIARQDNVTTGTGRGSSGTPAPINLEASERATHLREICGSWARMVLEHDVPYMSGVEPIAYLRLSVHVIMRHDWAGDLTNELDDALKAVLRAVDIPPERVDLGQCGTPDCPGRITGQMGQRNGKKMVDGPARCKECGTRYDGRDVYANLAATTWNHWCNLAEAVRLVLTVPGAPSRATLYRWAESGKLWHTVGLGEDLYCPAQIIARADIKAKAA